jgi:AcrR family transcriptional regulator
MNLMDATTAADPDRRAPGRPRSARSERAIIDAVLDMIAEGVAIETMSVESIAARAGVGKATIYRRWSSKEQLVMDAVASVKLPVPRVAGESVRADLITLLSAIAQGAAHRHGAVMTCILPQIARNPELHHWYQRTIEPRREATRRVLRRGVATGELRPDIDLETTVLLLASPMILQRTVRWNPANDGPDLAERVVDAVLAGAAQPDRLRRDTIRIDSANPSPRR